MTHDRDYWRDQNVTSLREAARDSGHELCIALGERLYEIEDLEGELRDREAEAQELRAKIEAAQVALGAE